MGHPSLLERMMSRLKVPLLIALLKGLVLFKRSPIRRLIKRQEAARDESSSHDVGVDLSDLDQEALNLLTPRVERDAV